MVVQHNLTAMNSNRMLGITTGSQAKSTEKLSSGYKINRAADDAAGLSISEKMRKQIRGLTQASLNAEDGISAVQTAEGALNEVQDMLQRMNELAVKSANGTMSEDDRKYIQDEIDQLVTEIDRVSSTTKFNETYLLKGEEGTSTFTPKYNAEITSTVALKAGETMPDLYAEGSTEKVAKEDIDKYFEVDKDGKVALKDGVVLYTEAADKNGEYGNQTKDKIAADTVWKDVIVVSTNALTKQDGTVVKEEELKDYFAEDGSYEGGLYKAATADGAATEVGAEQIGKYITVKEDVAENTLTLSLHVGADATEDNQISVDIQSMSAKGLGVDGLKVDGKDDTNALAAIDTIKEAIQQVSTQRSALGAVQNRLEHTIANLDNVVENTTAAESQIRDTDMATEMVKYSNNNILAQAGQAMLAQANQANQGVLSLLG